MKIKELIIEETTFEDRKKMLEKIIAFAIKNGFTIENVFWHIGEINLSVPPYKIK